MGQCPKLSCHLGLLHAQGIELHDQDVHGLTAARGPHSHLLQPVQEPLRPVGIWFKILNRDLYPQVTQLGLDAVLLSRHILRNRVLQSYQRAYLQRFTVRGIYPLQLLRPQADSQLLAVHRVCLAQLLAAHCRDICRVHHDVVDPQLHQPVMYPEPAEPCFVHGVVLRSRIVTCQEPVKGVRVRTLAHPLQHRGLRQDCHRPTSQMNIYSDVDVLSFEGNSFTLCHKLLFIWCF